MKPKYYSILLAVLVLGCSHAQKPVSKVDKLNTTGIQQGDAIVVLSETRANGKYHEEKIGECISSAFKKQNSKIEILPSDEFRRTFFSDLNLPGGYSTKEAFDSMFANKQTLQRIKPYNIHYIVLTSLETLGFNKHIVDLGIYLESRVGQITSVNGWVFDMTQQRESGKIATRVEAEWTNRGLGPIPIYLGRGGTESKACQAFGEEVAKFFMEKETNESL
jgi:hypothetical protein